MGRNEKLSEKVSGVPAVRERDVADDVTAMLKKMGPQILAALPTTAKLTPERLGRIVVTTIRLTPALGKCEPASLVGALIACAQLGLEPDPNTGLAYLVPFKRSKKEDNVWREWWECQLIVGYRGKIVLALRSGLVSTVEAHVVREGDEFQMEFGLVPRLVHRPVLRGEAGALTGAYCIVRMKDGSVLFDYMSDVEVEAIRRRVEDKNTKGARDEKARAEMIARTPWATDTARMWCKTVAHRTLKMVPMSPESSAADAVDGAVVRGIGKSGPLLTMPGEDPLLEPTNESADAPPDPIPLADVIKDVQARRREMDAAGEGEAFVHACIDLEIEPTDWATRGELVRELAHRLGVPA